MQIGMIGLGKMGINLVENMLRNEIEVSAFDISENARKQAQKIGATVIQEVGSLSNLPKPRIVWMMLPAGEVTNQMVHQLSEILEPGDLLVDGGNSFYQDSIANAECCQLKEIYFFDCGTSGGVDGALNGGNFMIGGNEEMFHRYLQPIFEKIAQKDGYLYTGKVGSGHYLKMVHNGIEYGMMQAIGEGFEILEEGPFDYDLHSVAYLWNHGSVIRSWLMELMAESFEKDAHLDKLTGVVHSSGEGLWTIEEAFKLGIPAPIITMSLQMRLRSQQSDTFAGKVVSSLRNGFGGHAVEQAK